MIDRNVMTIAQNTRTWMESRWKPKNLSGACGIASAVLFKSLKNVDKQVELAATYDENKDGGHAFVILNEKVLIDLTATQYGLFDPVTVRLLSDANMWFWTSERVIFKRLKDFKSFQINQEWPEFQWVKDYA